MAGIGNTIVGTLGFRRADPVRVFDTVTAYRLSNSRCMSSSSNISVQTLVVLSLAKIPNVSPTTSRRIGKRPAMLGDCEIALASSRTQIECHGTW
jgi:hypothetical protein